MRWSFAVNACECVGVAVADRAARRRRAGRIRPKRFVTDRIDGYWTSRGLPGRGWSATNSSRHRPPRRSRTTPPRCRALVVPVDNRTSRTVAVDLAGVAALRIRSANGIRGNCRRIHCLWCSLVFESGVEALCEHVPDAADGAGVGVDPDGEAVTEQEHGDGYRCVDQR